MYEQLIVAILVELLIGLARLTLVPAIAWVVRQLKGLSKSSA